MREAASAAGNGGLFQSAPDREVGRCRRVRSFAGCPISFNPRPTVRSGDAGGARQVEAAEAVSIRARP